MSISEILAIVFGAAGMVTGIISLIITMLGYNRSKFDVINSFFQYMLDSEFIQSRKFIYNLPENTVIDNSCSNEEQNYVAIVANTYHHYGLLVEHGQLPLWLFCDKHNKLTASGIAVIRMYNKLKPTIKNRRDNGNVEYAMYFESLYDELIKHCPNYKDYTG